MLGSPAMEMVISTLILYAAPGRLGGGDGGGGDGGEGGDGDGCGGSGGGGGDGRGGGGGGDGCGGGAGDVGGGGGSDGVEVAQLAYAAQYCAQCDGTPAQSGVGSVTQKAHVAHTAPLTESERHSGWTLSQSIGTVATGVVVAQMVKCDT